VEPDPGIGVPVGSPLKSARVTLPVPPAVLAVRGGVPLPLPPTVMGAPVRLVPRLSPSRLTPAGKT
jgi:hypothetical protein